MAVKYTILDVKDIFLNSGYTLISTEYKNNKQKLDYACPKGHLGSMSLTNFLSNNRRCPHCAGNKKLTLEFVRKEFSKRGYTLLSDVYVNAHTKLTYRCNKGHMNVVTWHHFKAGEKCSYCAHRKFSYENSLENIFPEIASEWHPIRNRGLSPSEVFASSNIDVWWKCPVCDYEWESSINNRTNKTHKRGCPACSGSVVTDYNNLLALFPVLCGEWHKNKNALSSCEVLPSSNLKVWWECTVCGYEWEAIVNDRTRKSCFSGGRKRGPTGCPFCANQIITEDNNLKKLFPYISEEWSYALNGGLCPEMFFPYSNKRVWWECSRCGNKWETHIYNRTRSNSGCPYCSGGPVSGISQEWLDKLLILIREHTIKILDTVLKVDGFDPETNTVYEFLGDYWHGNPEVYSPEKINPSSKKSYGQLYQETMERIDLLKENGYNVIYIWESDYRRGLE